MARFHPLRNPSTFRKIAAAIWRAPNDPSIHGRLSVDMTPVLKLLEELRASSGVKVTITHLVARAVAMAFAKHPDLNAKVRFGRIYLRDSVDLFVQVSEAGGADLSGVRLASADKKGLVELAKAIQEQAQAIRKGRDPSLAKSRASIRFLPWFLVRPMIAIADFLANTLQLDLPSAGMPRDPFGTAMVTSVGMFGIDDGVAPFTPIARCAAVILVGEVRDRPWVESGQLCVRPVMYLSGTFDHRVIDGYHAGLIASEVRTLLAEPAQCL